jgi:hypothetical protein
VCGPLHHLRTSLNEVSQGCHDEPQKEKNDPMNLAQDQHVAGLSDVLRGCTPMYPAAMRFAYYPAQLDDQRHQWMTRRAIPSRIRSRSKPSILHCRAMASAASRGIQRKRGFHCEPCPPSLLLFEERPDTGVGYS